MIDSNDKFYSVFNFLFPKCMAVVVNFTGYHLYLHTEYSQNDKLK